MNPRLDDVLRRALDVTVAGALLLLFLPLVGPLAVLVKLSTPGPAFFVQERVGRGGRRFRMLKLRTMVRDASQRGRQLTVEGDPRITPIGHCLRRLKLDELPQLWNVLRGDMSLVGPRPEVPRYVACYDDRQRGVLRTRPGITDPASIAYRHEERVLRGASDPDRLYREQVMPAKIALSLDYLEHRTVLSDLQILASTALHLLIPFRAPAPRTTA